LKIRVSVVRFRPWAPSLQSCSPPIEDGQEDARDALLPVDHAHVCEDPNRDGRLLPAASKALTAGLQGVPG
jgi:hypothetical protein